MLKLIDTKTVHEVDIDGTIFRVRAWRWRDGEVWEDVRSRILSIPEAHAVLAHLRKKDKEMTDEQADRIMSIMSVNLTEADVGNLNDILVRSIDSVDGIDQMEIGGKTPSIRELVEAMQREDILVLAGRIWDLSRVDEDTEKKSDGSSSSTENAK